MAVLRLGPTSLLASRFAISPLAETLSQMHRLHRAIDSKQHSSATLRLQRWLRRDPYAAGLLRLVSSTSYLPEFVAIPPETVHTKITDELALMASTPDADALETLVQSQQHSWASPGIEWAREPHVAHRAAETFERAWHEYVEPHWPRRRVILERDIRYRAGIVATAGWRHALDGMAKKIKWVGHDAVQFSTNTSHYDQTITGDGLVLVPHTGPDGQWTCDSRTRTALVYPARGSAATQATRSGMHQLIGATKSKIIIELQTPATPSQLATLLELSLGTIAQHLADLQEADVVLATRHGRAVYYSLTTSGAQLAEIVAAQPRTT